MKTELLIDGNYSRIDDKKTFDLIAWDGETVTAPDGYTVRQSGNDVLIFNNETEATLHCIIVDADFVIAG